MKINQKKYFKKNCLKLMALNWALRIYLSFTYYFILLLKCIIYEYLSFGTGCSKHCEEDGFLKFALGYEAFDRILGLWWKIDIDGLYYAVSQLMCLEVYFTFAGGLDELKKGLVKPQVLDIFLKKFSIKFIWKWDRICKYIFCY